MKLKESPRFHDVRLARLARKSDKWLAKSQLMQLVPYGELPYWIELGWTYIEPVGFKSLQGMGAIRTEPRAARIQYQTG